MTSALGKAELALLAESVGNANARIRFFRVAFGVFSPDQMMSPREVGSILTDLFAGTRLSVAWTIPDALPRQDVKLAFLLLQCLETAMPWGGQVTVTQVDGKITVAGASDKLRVEDALFDALITGEVPDEMRPSLVQFALVPLELAARDRTLTIRRNTEHIALTF